VGTSTPFPSDCHLIDDLKSMHYDVVD
jgi:hypothetical protein